MKQPISFIAGLKVDDEDSRLMVLFDEMEKRQLEFLDEAGKRIIELSSALLGILFAVTAFGDKFPPAYLHDAPLAKGLVILTLALHLAAIGAGLWTVQPRAYRQWEANLSGMRLELDKIIRHKTRCFRGASWLFGLGALSLAALVVAILWKA